MLEIKNLSVYHNKDLTPLISDLSFTLVNVNEYLSQVLANI